MKLYTKEQVTNVFQKYWLTSGVSNELERLLEQEKSIELPTWDDVKLAIEIARIYHIDSVSNDDIIQDLKQSKTN